MQSFIYDIDRKVFRNSSGLVRTSFKPSISYGERSTWEIQIQATDAGIVSLGGATAWRAAIDQDFTSSTEPMVRTTSGITVDTTGEWPVATVSLDTLTERFLAVCDGRQSTPVYFELAGLDANGDTVFYLCFAIDALFPIDPQAAGTLAPVEVTTLTESQVQAIARAAGEAAAKDAATSAASTVAADLTTHTSDTAIHVPTSGTTGQVLTKTDTGTEWKDATTSSGSTDLSDYYTKGEVSTLVSSETTARAAADSALETRVKALEQGSSGTVAVTGGVVPVDALPVASESTSGTVYYLTTDGHHYQVVPIGTADALGVRLSGDSIAFAGDYLPTGETTSVTYQDMTTLATVTKSFPVYSDGTRYLFAVVNSYALAPLYAIASSTTATPDYYAPSSDIAALSGDWYDSTYTTKSTVTAAQYVLEDVSHAYTLPTASASTLGGVKVGTGLSVSEDGTLSSTGEAYTLPTASASTLGGVKVGTGLTVSEDGTLSAISVASSDSITEFSTTYREWTKDDVGKLFRYTGETSGQFFKGRLYQGIHWKEYVNGGYDNVVATSSSSGDSDTGDSGSGDSGGTSTATVVSYVIVATSELAIYSGTYTLTSGTDGSTDAIYTGDNGMYMWYGKYWAGTSCWVCGKAVNAGAAPTNDPYIYSDTDSITGSWSKNDSDYTGVVTSVTRQEASAASNSANAVNAASLTADSSSSSSSTTDAYPDWPLTITIGTWLDAQGVALSSSSSFWHSYYGTWCEQTTGEFVRTGETLTILGETVPVWSNGTAYIQACSSATTVATSKPVLSLSLRSPSVGNDAYVNAYAYRPIPTTSSVTIGRPESGTTVETSIGGSGVWAVGNLNSDVGIQASLVETYSGSDSGSDWPPAVCGSPNAPPSNCLEFWTDYYGCAIVTTGASRDWTDEQEDWENNEFPDLTCYPGGRYYAHVTTDKARTLNAGTYSGPPLAECEVILNMDASTSVTCGSSITLRGSLIAGQVNFCRLVWTGNSAATLIVQ